MRQRIYLEHFYLTGTSRHLFDLDDSEVNYLKRLHHVGFRRYDQSLTLQQCIFFAMRSLSVGTPTLWTLMTDQRRPSVNGSIGGLATWSNFAVFQDRTQHLKYPSAFKSRIANCCDDRPDYWLVANVMIYTPRAAECIKGKLMTVEHWSLRAFVRVNQSPGCERW